MNEAGPSEKPRNWKWADLKQITGEYQVKNAGLKPKHEEAKSILLSRRASITHIPREKNKEPDALADETLDKRINIRAENDR